MAEPAFDAAAYRAGLATAWIGRAIETRAAVDSTNDAAWEALGRGAADGLAVVADAQLRGRGRAGRAWSTAPGRGLALSLLLRRGCERRPLGVLPLAAGLALVRALEALGVDAALKWPNDVLIGGRKAAGILVESRASLDAGGERAAVVGVGVNVAERAQDLPAAPDGAGSDGAPVARPATSLAIEGHAVAREAVAAELMNAFEPLWVDLERSGAAPLLEAWTARAAFWGETLRVRTPGGLVAGRARSLDADGALLLDLGDGATARIVTGDELPPLAAPAGR